MNQQGMAVADIKTLPLARSQSAIAAIFAAALGLFLLWGVGFAGPEQIHNTAHDTRHSFVFPCH